MKIYMHRFFDAATGGAGGSSPSLAELFTPGDGTPKAADLSDHSKTPPQSPVPPTPPVETPKPTPPVEGVNEDGSLQEGYIKDAEGKVAKDPNYKPAADTKDQQQDEETDDPAAFWEDVNKLHGEEINVEFPDGMDPLSPEGVHFRDKVIQERAVDKFEAHLKATDPRGYAYLLHRLKGGNDEDFFASKSISLPEYEAFKANQDTQIAVYKSSLISKGLDAETAQLAVDKAIQGNKLFDVADAAYKAAQQQQADQLAAIENANKAQQAEYSRSVNSLNQSLSTSINEGKGLNIKIPDADKAPFLNYVREMVEYDSQRKTFLVAQPIAAEKLPRMLEALFLQYKNGDVKELIMREAMTQNRKRLGRTIEKSKTGPSGGAEGANNPGGSSSYVPLSQIL